MANIIMDSPYTGKTFGNMLVLNRHKSGAYYVRVDFGGAYGITRATEEQLLNCITPYQMLNRLVENPYIKYDDRVELFTLTGYKFTIDLEDFDKVHAHVWSNVTKGYLYGCVDKTYRRVYLHRFILGVHNQPSYIQVDHKDWDISDNRKSKLRVVDNRVNNQNKPGHIENELRGIRAVGHKFRVYFKYKG